MSSQLALCSRVLKTGDISPVLNFGITPDDFTNGEARALWGYILDYYIQPESRGSVLSVGQLGKWFSDYQLPDDRPSTTLEALCYEVRSERIRVEMNTALIKCAEDIVQPAANPGPPISALQTVVSRLLALGTTANTDMSLKYGLDRLQQKLRLARQGHDLSVLCWPWEALQKATFGIQQDDYVVFYGRPKSMKTWILVKLIAHAWEYEKPVLVYTKEMTQDNIYLRATSCICRLLYDELREAGAAEGRPLSPEGAAQLSALSQMVLSTPHLGNLLTVLSGRDTSGGDTVAWLDSKVDQYKPALIFIDGMYLLTDQRKSKEPNQRVQSISRDLRQMNLQTGVPIIATMQANRKAAAHNDANLDEIAFSDALGQDCTIAARVIKDKNAPTVSVIIGGSREFKLHGLRINAIPARDFSYIETLTESDIEKAKEADQSEVEDKSAKEHVRAPKRPRQPQPKTVEVIGQAMKEL